MTSLTRVFAKAHHFARFYSTSSVLYEKSGFFSENYHLESEWEKRLGSPLLQRIEPDEFFFEIDKKYQADKIVSAVDVDLFVNKVSSEEFIDEVEELAYRLRKSPAAAEILPSTSHAVIRTLISINRLDIAMRMLDDRMNYGIFLDHFLANILMDKFLSDSNFRDAAKVACLNMLQEDFGGSTTKLLSVLSCLRYVENPTPTPWAEEDPVDEKEKSKEETKIRVRFLRQPGFDDHFDLTNPEHLVGKTLAYASFGLTEVDEIARRSVAVLGWALYDKWEKVENILKMSAAKKEPFAAEVVQKMISLAESRMQLVEGSPDKSLPRPKLKRVPGMNLDKDSVDKLFQQLGTPDYSKIIPAVLDILKSSDFPKVEVSLVSGIEESLRKAVTESESKEINNQKKLYQEWEGTRLKLLQEQVQRLKNERRLQEIEEQKKELAEKEEKIFFFDNEEEWMMRQPPKVRVYRMRYRGKYKPPKVKEDEAYVPPTI